MRWQMLDRIDEMKAHGSALGRKAVCESEDYFEHHFPGYPLVPGAILIESMAQLAGHLAMYTAEKERGTPYWAVLVRVEDAHFTGKVRPGEVLVIRADLVDLEQASATAECDVRVDERPVAIATLELALVPFVGHTALDRTNAARMQADRQRLWEGCDLP